MENTIVDDLLKKLRECDDFHNRCDYLIEHSEITYLLEYINDLREDIEKAIDKIQLLIDIGFDYDGLNKVESLKGLIDELVSYAIESRNILKGDSDE